LSWIGAIFTLVVQSWSWAKFGEWHWYTFADCLAAAGIVVPHSETGWLGIDFAFNGLATSVSLAGILGVYFPIIAAALLALFFVTVGRKLQR
jgi:membrane protein implicated in regulation of membrane protease activity